MTQEEASINHGKVASHGGSFCLKPKGIVELYEVVTKNKLRETNNEGDHGSGKVGKNGGFKGKKALGGGDVRVERDNIKGEEDTMRREGGGREEVDEGEGIREVKAVREENGKKLMVEPLGGLLKNIAVVGANRAADKRGFVDLRNDVEGTNPEAGGRGVGEKAELLEREDREGGEAKGNQPIMEGGEGDLEDRGVGGRVVEVAEAFLDIPHLVEKGDAKIFVRRLDDEVVVGGELQEGFLEIRVKAGEGMRVKRGGKIGEGIRDGFREKGDGRRVERGIGDAKRRRRRIRVEENAEAVGAIKISKSGGEDGERGRRRGRDVMEPEAKKFLLGKREREGREVVNGKVRDPSIYLGGGFSTKSDGRIEGGIEEWEPKEVSLPLPLGGRRRFLVARPPFFGKERRLREEEVEPGGGGRGLRIGWGGGRI